MKVFVATLCIIVKNWEQGKLHFTFVVSLTLWSMLVLRLFHKWGNGGCKDEMTCLWGWFQFRPYLLGSEACTLLTTVQWNEWTLSRVMLSNWLSLKSVRLHVVFVCVHTHICVNAWVCLCVCVEVRGQHEISFSICTIYFERELSLNLELTDTASKF